MSTSEGRPVANLLHPGQQNGPEAYSSGGNAANLDLNRDFVKMDSRNAEAFVRMYHAVQPDVFVDTHTSNGADYPYTMTLITTQPDKAGPVMGPFLRDKMEPALFEGMQDKGWPMVPYVYSMGETPESGILGFLETPRYSTGYTTLFGTLGFTTEAHMLKPFVDRVASTHAFLTTLSEWLDAHGAEVKAIRDAERERLAQASTLPVRWTVSEDVDSIPFTGFVSRREWSAVTKGTRLKYDTSQTWSHPIAWANRYDASVEVSLPDAWILPQAWRRVATRLQANGVEMRPLDKDTTMLLHVTWVEAFESSSRPYEGHHPVRVDSVRKEWVPVELYRGDWVIPRINPPNATSQKSFRRRPTTRFWCGISLTRRCSAKSTTLAMCLRTQRRNFFATTKPFASGTSLPKRAIPSGPNNLVWPSVGCTSKARTTRARPTGTPCTR